MTRVCGVDTGGTFTDLVIIDDQEIVQVLKTPSTPPDFERGVLEALRLAKVLDGEGSAVETIAHGTTVGTNAVLEEAVSTVALITTAGFGDTLFQMRGAGRVAGLPDERVLAVHETDKPTPLVVRDLVFEIDERVDSFGEIVVQIDLEQVREIAGRLLDEQVPSVAVCLLWSFLNPSHERAVRDVLVELIPEVHVSISSEVAPRWGEYERFVATVLNASLRPVMSSYVQNLEAHLDGHPSRLYLMQSNGGTISASESTKTPVLTLDSGPVGGIMACAALGKRMGLPNIIATDMGGTSFDVGIVHDYVPLSSRTSIVRQYEYFVPAIQVKSIGAGGGSIASVDPITGGLNVGPASAGSVPGPAAYGRGGIEPTVCDADVVLGRLNPDNFWGGKLRLRTDLAEAALQPVADALGLGLAETAAGISAIIDSRMADLIRSTTVRRGLDPRDFVLFAYGGAGPAHVGAYARELGCRSVVIPHGNAASAWSAYGVALADVVRVYEKTAIRSLPVDPDELNETLVDLERRAHEELFEQGVATGDAVLQRSADVRFKNQVYELAIPLPSGRLEGAHLDQLALDFSTTYEAVYGQGAGFKGMGLELVTLRVRATGALVSPSKESVAVPYEIRRIDPTATRDVYWDDIKDFTETSIFSNAAQFVPGSLVEGPAVVELPDTTVCVHPDQVVTVDAFANLVLSARDDRATTGESRL